MEQSYKEKYEDILARLERAKNDNEVCDERFCCVINEIIPELAESEDEKVGKELIKHLKELSDWKEDEVIPVKNPSYYRQWASWLEKQEEHANFRNKIQVGDKVTRNENGVLVNISQLRRVAKPSEKQCGQKFEMKTAEESLGIDSDTYNKIVDECIFGEQKPKENKGNIGGNSANWSEEDEKNLRRAIRATKVVYPVAADWLQSLQDRVQPKQEWSEEDESILQGIWDEILANKHDAKECEWKTYDKFLNWLKSLKERIGGKV